MFNDDKIGNSRQETSEKFEGTTWQTTGGRPWVVVHGWSSMYSFTVVFKIQGAWKYA